MADKSGSTPLILAASGARHELCKILIEHRSPLEISDMEGRAAQRFSSSQLSTWKVIAGHALASMTHNDTHAGSTALHHAARRRRPCALRPR